MSLSAARKRRDEVKALLAAGVDPAAAKKSARAAAGAPDNTFESVAREWLDQAKPSWVPRHAERVEGQLVRHVFKYIGRRPVNEVTAHEVLQIVQRVHKRGHEELALRLRQKVDEIFRYAIVTQRTDRNPAAEVKGSVKRTTPASERRFPTITEAKAVGALVRAIRGYDGTPITRIGLELLLLTALRQGELRQLRWSHVDFEAKLITVPALLMKGKKLHTVPLSKQAIALLRELHTLTGKTKLLIDEDPYLFPSERSRGRPMSDGTLGAALRRMGYAQGVIVPHGFRSTFSTTMNEQQWDVDAIELQLAHVDASVRRVYARHQHLELRTKMMQSWSDYLDQLADDGSVVVNIGRRKR